MFLFLPVVDINCKTQSLDVPVSADLSATSVAESVNSPLTIVLSSLSSPCFQQQPTSNNNVFTSDIK